MDVNSIFMNRIAEKADKGGYTANTSVTGQSFDSFMNRTTSSSSKDLRKQDFAGVSDRRRPDDRKNAVSKNNVETQKEYEDNKNKAVASEPSKTNNNVAAKNNSKPQGEEKKQLNDKVVDELAQELNVPAEVVLQVLEQMNITALELNDEMNLSDFCQTLIGTEDYAALMNAPAEEQLMEGIRDILSQFTEVAGEETESVRVFQNGLGEMDSKESESVIGSVSDKPTDELSASTDIYEEAEQPEPRAKVESESTSFKGQETAEPVKESLIASAGQESHLDDFQDNDAFSAGISEARQIQNESVKTEASSGVNTREVISQILEKMKAEIKGDVSEIKLTLKPEHLGDVTLKISTEKGIVTASFIAENQRVKEIIESNFNQLKDALAEQGIQVSQLSVSVGQNNQQRMMEEFMRRQQTSSRINKISNVRAEAAPLVMPEENYTSPYDVLENSVDFTA